MSDHADAARPANRLAGETSPYLLQHRFNPVDWYPWGEEALAKARAENRPIFLSVGYSACHWCHVMERESFESEEIAELLNERFVCIKVDREERPDLDQIYMNAVVALTGQGGWPMSVFLTPDRRPFYGGTYWPPRAKFGRPGFADVVVKVHEAFANRRGDIDENAEKLTEAIADMAAPGGARVELNKATIAKAGRQLLNTADREHGGFGGAPKFPHAMDLRVLPRAARLGADGSVFFASFTLDKMARGGIRDQLGGGFHRYATDAAWLVPHFEKMLYDQALLVPAYLEAYAVTKRADFADVVRTTLDYVLREMTADCGAFFATQDADSEGEEGKFFVWDRTEVDRLLGPDDAELFSTVYDITPRGNWEGHNIPQRLKTPAADADRLGIATDDLEARLAAMRRTLFEARENRIKPARDDKHVTAWNGMMLAAFARSGFVLNEPEYLEAAVRAADFQIGQATRYGGLQHSVKDGVHSGPAFLDDFACLIDGLVELASATSNEYWIEQAIGFTETMLSEFRDTDGDGGFYYARPDANDPLIVRLKDGQDNATPSGNGMAATALLKLHTLTLRDDFEEVAVETLDRLSGQMTRYPSASGQSLIALARLTDPPPEVVVADGADPAEGDLLVAEVRATSRPGVLSWRVPHGFEPDESHPLARLLDGKTAVDDRAAAYVCRGGQCLAPVTSAGDLAAALRA